MLKVVMGPRLGIDIWKFEPTDDVLIMDEWIRPDGTDPVEEIIATSSKPKSITSEHYTDIKDCSYRDILNPASAFFYHELEEFSKLPNAPTTQPRNVCFSFMLNRKRLARLLLIRMVEYFNLNSYNYSLCFSNTAFDASVIIPMIDLSDIKDKEKLKQVLLGSTALTPKIWHKTSVSTAENIDNFDYGNHNSLNYAQIIKPLFDSSIVSIIVETVGHERATTFTEKSLMPVLSMNFPLWFGGYQQAEFFKDLGFDVFDDVIDHSYQHRNNYLERCYYAIADNYSILSNLEFATQQHQKYITRLERNKQYAQSDTCRQRLMERILRSHPDVVTWLTDNFLHNGYYWA